MELPYYAIEITNLFPHLIQTNPGILPRTPSFAKLWRWIATLASSPRLVYGTLVKLGAGRAGRWVESGWGFGLEHVEPVEDEKIFQLPSGKQTKSYWKWPFIVDFPIKNGDFP